MKTTGLSLKNKLNAIAFLIGVILSPAVSAQWNSVLLENSTIPASANQFVKFANSSTGYYQNSRYLYKTTNGGINWNRIDSTTASNYERIDIQVLSANDIFCIESHNLGNYTYTYYLRKSSNGGLTWTSTLIPYVGNNANGYYNDFHFSGTSNGMLAMAYGKMYHTSNGGASWTQVSLQTTTEYIARFDFASANVGYALETFGKLYKTTDGGATWAYLSNVCSTNCSNFLDIEFIHQDTGLAVNGYYIYKTVDGGASWTAKPNSGQFLVYRDIEYAGSDTVYIGAGSFCRSTDGGETFQALSYLNPSTWLPFSSSMLYSVAAPTASSVFVTGVSNASPSVSVPGVYKMSNNGIGCPSALMNGTLTVCPGSSNNFTVQTTATAPAPYVYSWTPSSYLGTPSNYYSQGINSTPDDTVVFTVTITDTTFGCPVASGQQTVITLHNSNWQNPWPWPTNPVVACPGDTLHMGPGALGYQWNTGDTTEYVILNTFPAFYSCMVDVCPGGNSALYFAVSLDSNCTVQTCGVDAGPDTVFCQLQGQLNAQPASPGTYSFSWSPAYGLSNPNVQNPTVISGVHNQQYIVTMTDQAGNCTATDTVIVSAYYWHIDTIYMCGGFPVTYDLGPGGTQYTTQYTDTSGNGQFQVLPNNYLVATQPATYLCIAYYPGCGALTSLITVIDSCNVPVGNVWPGDCNYDLVANMADVLHIGIGYNTTGAQRPSATNGWYAQPMTDWNQNFIGCNYKHADADGNGVINVNDTVPVSQNYGLTHPYSFVPQTQVNASTPVLQLVASYDTCGLQTLVNVDIRLGTPSIPVDSLYGIAFRISMDANLIDTTLTSMNFGGSWLGTVSSNMISFLKPFRSAGVMDACEVRSNQQNVYGGSGSIGSFQIVTTDNLSGISVLHLNVSNVTAVTLDETIIPLALVADSVIIDPAVISGISEHENLAGFHLYPNPANEEVFVNTTTAGAEITVLDLLGRTVAAQKALSLNTRIATGELNTGVYLVRVKQGNAVQTQKLTITR